jgi:cytochrome c oxidase subunit 3
LSETLSLELREQFATPAQQRETASIGMWLFLASEIMMFGALFLAYTVYRLSHPHAFNIGSSEMTLVIGSVNTAVIICSSFTMALAVYFMGAGYPKRTVFLLLLSIVIGLIFLALKFSEYYIHFQEHKFPGVWWEHAGPSAGQIEMFYVFYFIMTGLHVVHMSIGIGLLCLMAVRTALGHFNSEYYTPLEIVGIYWSFVDCIWIFLYAVLYLPGMHLR